MSTLQHNLDHGPAVVETMLDFCRAVQKTGGASLQNGTNGQFVNFGDGEVGRAPSKSEMDKSERIRLKNRRAQQKLRDRMRHDVEGLEAALEESTKARLALQLERRDLENEFLAGVHALAVKGMFPVIEGILRPQKESNVDFSSYISHVREIMPASTANGSVEEIVNRIPNAEAAVCVFSKEQKKLNELGSSGRIVEMRVAFEQIIASFWSLSQEKPDIFSEFLLLSQQRPSEAQGNKKYELIAHEINLCPSEVKSIRKLLHAFSLDLKKWALAMEQSNNLDCNDSNCNHLGLCFAESSWSECTIVEKACAGAQSRLTFAVLKAFAQIQQVISLEKFAYTWALSPTVVPDVLALCHSICSKQPDM